MGGLLGGPKGMLAPPLKLLGGLAPPLPTPMEECENYEEIRERCRLDLSQLAY